MRERNAVVSENFPATWYVWGEWVLDQLAGSVRADNVSVVAEQVNINPAEVRERLNIPRAIGVTINTTRHSVAASIDTPVLLPDGNFWDILSGHVTPRPRWPLELRLVSADVSYTDVVRLSATISGYPELIATVELRDKLRADLVYLRSIANSDPDVATSLIASTPISSWRREGNATI